MARSGPLLRRILAGYERHAWGAVLVFVGSALVLAVLWVITLLDLAPGGEGLSMRETIIVSVVLGVVLLGAAAWAGLNFDAALRPEKLPTLKELPRLGDPAAVQLEVDQDLAAGTETWGPCTFASRWLLFDGSYLRVLRYDEIRSVKQTSRTTNQNQIEVRTFTVELAWGADCTDSAIVQHRDAMNVLTELRKRTRSVPGQVAWALEDDVYLELGELFER